MFVLPKTFLSVVSKFAIVFSLIFLSARRCCSQRIRPLNSDDQKSMEQYLSAQLTDVKPENFYDLVRSLTYLKSESLQANKSEFCRFALQSISENNEHDCFDGLRAASLLNCSAKDSLKHNLKKMWTTHVDTFKTRSTDIKSTYCRVEALLALQILGARSDTDSMDVPGIANSIAASQLPTGLFPDDEAELGHGRALQNAALALHVVASLSSLDRSGGNVAAAARKMLSKRDVLLEQVDPDNATSSLFPSASHIPPFPRSKPPFSTPVRTPPGRWPRSMTRHTGSH